MLVTRAVIKARKWLAWAIFSSLHLIFCSVFSSISKLLRTKDKEKNVSVFGRRKTSFSELATISKILRILVYFINTFLEATWRVSQETFSTDKAPKSHLHSLENKGGKNRGISDWVFMQTPVFLWPVQAGGKFESERAQR